MEINKLKEERIKREISVEDIATLLNIKPVTYYQYENGSRTVPEDIAKEISRIFEIDEKDIFLPNRYSIRK